MPTKSRSLDSGSRPIMKHAFRRVPGATPPLRKVRSWTPWSIFDSRWRLENLECGHQLKLRGSEPHRDRRRCLACLTSEQAKKARRA